MKSAEKPMPPPATARPEQTESREFNGDKATISKRSPERIHTLDQLLAFCEVDPQEWEVERWVCNKWEVGGFPRATRQAGADFRDWVRPAGDIEIHPLYQVKAWLKRKTNLVAARRELDALREKAKGYAPKYAPIKRSKRRSRGSLAEYAIFDHHFGGLIWGKETGDADWDLPISEREWKRAGVALIERTAHLSLDEAVVVLGNDQQNADNRAGTTERGTPQQMDGRYQKVFGVSRDCSIWLVEQLRQVAPLVTIVIVAGNHDPTSCFHLGDTLTSWFHRCPGVRVDNSPAFRKYRQWGSCMLMWTHGNTGKIEEYDKTMAAEQPRMWGDTFWREAHTGDKHHRRLIETKGAAVRILPSLRPPCAWSSENHYLGSVRAAEAYVWSKDDGLILTATHSIKRSESKSDAPGEAGRNRQQRRR